MARPKQAAAENFSACGHGNEVRLTSILVRGIFIVLPAAARQHIRRETEYRAVPRIVSLLKSVRHAGAD